MGTSSYGDTNTDNGPISFTDFKVIFKVVSFMQFLNV